MLATTVSWFSVFIPITSTLLTGAVLFGLRWVWGKVQEQQNRNHNLVMDRLAQLQRNDEAQVMQVGDLDRRVAVVENTQFEMKGQIGVLIGLSRQDNTQ